VETTRVVAPASDSAPAVAPPEVVSPDEGDLPRDAVSADEKPETPPVLAVRTANVGAQDFDAMPHDLSAFVSKSADLETDKKAIAEFAANDDTETAGASLPTPAAVRMDDPRIPPELGESLARILREMDADRARGADISVLTPWQLVEIMAAERIVRFLCQDVLGEQRAEALPRPPRRGHVRAVVIAPGTLRATGYELGGDQRFSWKHGQIGEFPTESVDGIYLRKLDDA
jgi:hypothetical protein